MTVMENEKDGGDGRGGEDFGSDAQGDPEKIRHWEDAGPIYG